jgi:hypothetical protein
MLINWLKLVVHNCFIHPMLPFLPKPVEDALHDWSAEWTFGIEYYAEEDFQE